MKDEGNVDHRSDAEPSASDATKADDLADVPATRAAVIYCGFCGALNPAANRFCASCGSIMVDAFHASEGLRVFERPDAASRLIEIVAAGTELDVVEDASAPTDYARVRLSEGRLGYIRLADVEALNRAPGGVRARTPDVNTNARGCITSTAALGALVLLIVTATLGLTLILRSDSRDAGIYLLVFCFGVGPLLVLTTGLYLYARSREDRLQEEEEDLAGAAAE